MITMKWILSRESKVYGPVCNLTATMVLAHVLLGCCWHHHHAFGEELASTTYLDHTGVDCRGGGSGHVGACDHQPAGADHSHGSDCQGSHCVFGTERSPRMPAAPSAGICAGRAAAAAVADRLPAESRIWAKAFAAARRCPSLRIHLSQQVLLL